MSPEEARDQAVEEIIKAGGSILSTIPMALPDSPHVISAYEINAGASDIDVLKALAKVKKSYPKPAVQPNSQQQHLCLSW